MVSPVKPNFGFQIELDTSYLIKYIYYFSSSTFRANSVCRSLSHALSARMGQSCGPPFRSGDMRSVSLAVWSETARSPPVRVEPHLVLSQSCF